MNDPESLGGPTVDVIVVCDDCDAALAALREMKVELTSTESTLVGSIGARIAPEQTAAILLLPGVLSIEPDEQVDAF